MARVKRAVNAHKKRREILESAKGYRGQRSRLYRKAKEQMLHSMQYSYRDRRDRKRSEEHTSELQSQSNLVCRLLLEKKKKKKKKEKTTSKKNKLKKHR